MLFCANQIGLSIQPFPCALSGLGILGQPQTGVRGTWWYVMPAKNPLSSCTTLKLPLLIVDYVVTSHSLSFRCSIWWQMQTQTYQVTVHASGMWHTHLYLISISHAYLLKFSSILDGYHASIVYQLVEEEFSDFMGVVKVLCCDHMIINMEMVLHVHCTVSCIW